MSQPVEIDDQPISATFFGEGKWLTDFITPDALEIQLLYQEITEGIKNLEERLTALHDWVGSLKYKKFIKGKVWIDGKTSVQTDLWNMPSITARIGVGNCSNKSFLLCSLLRQELSADEVHCVLGNLYNGKPGGHAWCMLNIKGGEYIMESTRADVPSLVPAYSTERYEAVHLFNDKSVKAYLDRTVMEPFADCYSTWLVDYLDFAYIEGRK